MRNENRIPQITLSVFFYLHFQTENQNFVVCEFKDSQDRHSFENGLISAFEEKNAFLRPKFKPRLQ